MIYRKFFCNLFLFIHLHILSTSSYETDTNTGVSQLLEINSFKSTTSLSHNDLSTKIENLGGMVQCVATKENIFYCVEILRENIEQGIEILAGY